MSASSRTLLLVSPEGDALAAGIRRDLPQLDVTVAASDTAARAYLGASAFDVVVVGPSMPDSTASSLDALVGSLGRTSRVLAGAPSDGLVEWLRERLSLSLPVDPSEDATPTEQRVVLESVRDELARIAHALNNPLAVIDGNAQLALELSRALGVDASVVSAIEDIQGGSQSLAALFADLAALRQRVASLVD